MAPRIGSIFTLTALLAFLAGATLVVYGRWTRPIVLAAAALDAGNTEGAVAPYTDSARRFRSVALTQRILAPDYSLVAHNQLAALYTLGRYDEVIERAAEAPDGSAPHFWSGCALFKKSVQQTNPDAQLEWLTRSQEEFKLALAAAPDDWDTKFNYELTSRLAAAMRPGSDKRGKQQSNAPSTLMQLLRPQQQQKSQDRVVKKVG
ncbi:MAG: hypothetical protein ABIS06_07585 [Vicinamibacterales bacterium]